METILNSNYDLNNIEIYLSDEDVFVSIFVLLLLCFELDNLAARKS